MAPCRMVVNLLGLISIYVLSRIAPRRFGQPRAPLDVVVLDRLMAIGAAASTVIALTRKPRPARWCGRSAGTTGGAPCIHPFANGWMHRKSSTCVGNMHELRRTDETAIAAPWSSHDY